VSTSLYQPGRPIYDRPTLLAAFERLPNSEKQRIDNMTRMLSGKILGLGSHGALEILACLGEWLNMDRRPEMKDVP
jgi:hypothetical protein